MYREAVVMYTDILGFKELVKNTNPEVVYRILNLFAMPFKSGVLDSIAHDTNQYFTLDQLEEKYKALTRDDDDEDGVAAQVQLLDELDGKRKCYIFSDLVLTSLEVSENEEKQKLEAFLEEVDRIIEIQNILTDRAILIRGAITIDQIYSGKMVVFGPALISAYETENKIAVYPRICVDRRIMDRIRELDDGELSIRAQACITEDFDGIFFIDYLRDALHSWYVFFKDNGPEPILDQGLDAFLQKHKEHVREHLDLALGKPFENKLLWLKNYHNRLIREYGLRLKEGNLDMNKYLIRDNY